LAGYLAWFGGFEVVADCWAGGYPLFMLVTVPIGEHAGSSYEETGLRGCAGEDEGDGFAGSIAEFVPGGY
jgi:hypothetical protein